MCLREECLEGDMEIMFYREAGFNVTPQVVLIISTRMQIIAVAILFSLLALLMTKMIS